jgi:hypothetical protein
MTSQYFTPRTLAKTALGAAALVPVARLLVGTAPLQPERRSIQAIPRRRRWAM